MENITVENIRKNIEAMINKSWDKNMANFNHTSRLFFEFNKPYIINAVTFDYLIRWLDNDRNAAQTINNFAMNKYICVSDWKQKKNCGNTPLLDIDAGLRRAEKRLIDNLQAQIQQCKDAGLPYKEFPEFDSTNKKRYGFLELRYMDAYREGYLETEKLLFERKNVLKIENKTGKNDALRNAYDDLNRLLDNIRNNNPFNKSGKQNIEKSTVEFVVSCMQFYLYETSYRFVLMAKIAQYMETYNLPIYHPAISSIRFYILNLPKENCPITFTPFIHYNNFFKCERCYFEPFPIQCELEVQAMRILLQDAIDEYCYYNPVKELHSWKQSDFHDAAKFLVDDNHILDSLKNLDLKIPDGKSKSVYDYIRDLYSSDDFMDQAKLYYGRNYMQNSYKTNSRYRKNGLKG